MNPEIMRALMNERVRETHGHAAAWRWRASARRRPRVLSRTARPRPAWTTKTA